MKARRGADRPRRLAATGTRRRLRTVLINHLLEPPGRVTGITRFLFALLAALLEATEDSFVLLTCWAEGELPPTLLHPRLLTITRPFLKSGALNVMRQNRILPGVMRDTGAALEFNVNPIGGWRGAWPRILTVHDLYLDNMPRDYALRHRLVWKMLFPRVARSAAAIVAPSESTRRDLIAHYPFVRDRIVIVPEAPAFSQTGAAQPLPLQGRFGLIVGNLSPNKNAAVIVEALHRLAGKGVAIPLLHVGRDERGALDQAQRRFPLAAPVVSVAGVNDATLKKAYESAAFFVNASLHEGFCLPIVEAQSMGTPVIASNRSALPEVAGDGALLVDPQSPGAIADAMESVWTNAGRAACLSRKGRANAARYSWRESARRVAALFDSQSGAAASATAGANAEATRELQA